MSNLSLPDRNIPTLWEGTAPQGCRFAEFRCRAGLAHKGALRGLGWRESIAALLGFEHALAQRVANELVAVAQAQLLHDPLAIRVHRLWADHEFFGDLRAAIALGDQLQHLALTFGQP